jgi:Domain of unknown function DUF29
MIHCHTGLERGVEWGAVGHKTLQTVREWIDLGDLHQKHGRLEKALEGVNHGDMPPTAEGWCVSETRYETDFYAWLQAQAGHLRAKEWNSLDIDNLAEELDTLGRSERNAVWSHLRILLLHLLKWAYQPERRGRSWRRGILLARQHLARRLRDSPSLRPELPALVVEAYVDARRLAVVEADLPEAAFPATCPWTPDELQEEAFLPAL